MGLILDLNMEIKNVANLSRAINKRYMKFYSLSSREIRAVLSGLIPKKDALDCLEHWHYHHDGAVEGCKFKEHDVRVGEYGSEHAHSEFFDDIKTSITDNISEILSGIIKPESKCGNGDDSKIIGSDSLVDLWIGLSKDGEIICQQR